MWRIPVGTQIPVEVSENQSVPYSTGLIERQVFVVDTSGGANDYLVDTSPGFNYRLLCAHFHLANGPAASYIGVEVRAQGPWGIAEIFKNRRLVTANRDPEVSFVMNGAGSAINAIANSECYNDVSPAFLINESMMLYMNCGAGLGGYVSVLLERIPR